MIDQLMSGNAPPVREGAPFRALLFFVGFWVLARILSECFLINPFPVSQGATGKLETNGFDAELPCGSILSPTQHLAHGESQFEEEPDSNKGRYAKAQDNSDWMVQQKLDSHAMISSSRSNEPGPTSIALGDIPQRITFSLPDATKTEPEKGSKTIQPLATPIITNDRLSGYFWFFVRRSKNSEIGGNAPQGPGPIGSQYGGSQAGAHLTYRLVGQQNRNLSIFGRVSKALNSRDKEEFAIGLKAKPISNFPVSLHAEQRFARGAKSIRGTAFYVAGGTGPDLLHENITFETYGQAGYKFGADKTYFFDGSATVGRTVLIAGSNSIVLGGGVWAGGQRGARRVDIGPQARIDLPAGRFASRISMDWRGRIAGEAAPGSGVTVSLTSGF